MTDMVQCEIQPGINAASAQCYVYGITDTTALKVGMTGGGQGRVNELQTGNPNPLLEIIRIPCESRRIARVLERLLHEHLHGERKCGEWFWGKRTARLAYLYGAGPTSETVDEYVSSQFA